MKLRTHMLHLFPFLLALSMLCAVASPSVQAGVWNESTKVTFSGPVEIPGKVLPAGTYTFQLMNDPSNRNIVEIFNESRSKLYAVVMAIPTYRYTPRGKTVVTFEERPSDVPVAIHKWFYPGTQYGHEFVYSKRAEMEASVWYHRLKASVG